MRLILMFAACAVACAIAVAVTQGSSPSRSAYWQTICYLGKYGQPGGCRLVWVPGPGPV